MDQQKQMTGAIWGRFAAMIATSASIVPGRAGRCTRGIVLAHQKETSPFRRGAGTLMGAIGRHHAKTPLRGASRGQ